MQLRMSALPSAMIIALVTILVQTSAVRFGTAKANTNKKVEKLPTTVLIVGAGIAGLSAALEAARAGSEVTVVDMSSVGGGHAIASNGAISLVRTPLQNENGISDSPELAASDFLKRGEDAQRQWVELYVRESKVQIYDWLTTLGVTFDGIGRPPGNSVPRLHFSRGKGWGLVGPLFRETLRFPNIHFIWSTKADKLLTGADGAVNGLIATNLRTGGRISLKAQTVIVATGGFGSNLELVRKNWPSWLPEPDRLLAGASPSALGSGMEMVRDAGGTLSRLDHQWNYVLGLPDPDDPQHLRGLASFDSRSIWVNREGKRFTPEFGDPKINLSDLLHQTDKTYWSIFDAEGVNTFSITLAGWENQKEVSELVFQRSSVTIASTLEELARKAGFSPAGLQATIDRFNYLASQEDEDFHTFDFRASPRPHRIEKPPFYAVQFFPITRKTMGGVDVDLQCRVLDVTGTPIPGLFAAGEVTGFAGINGKAALEGTFLGPGILMGRIAAQTATKNHPQVNDAKLRSLPAIIAPATFSDKICVKCHDIPRQIAKKRSGFWHFELAHKQALNRHYPCGQCHQTFYPFRRGQHRLDYLVLTNACAMCHGVQSAEAK